MKKVIATIICVIFVFSLMGCNGSSVNKKESFWTEDDFSFYDANGKEKMFPTADDY